MTFSPVSALAGTLARSSLSSIRPAVLAFWLWQVTQYLSRRARCSMAVGAARRQATARAPAVNSLHIVGGTDRETPCMQAELYDLQVPVSRLEGAVIN